MSQTLFDQCSEPVQELFFLGEDVARSKEWPSYLDYGITSAHISELLRIIRQIQSFWDENQYTEDQGYTPIHAWRALGRLQATEAIDTLIFLIHENEEYNSDWIGEEIPIVLRMIGPQSIPALKAYLATPEKEQWAAITAAHSLEKIGNEYPESRSNCIAVLEHTLKEYFKNDETLNAFVISYLADLKAVESIHLVEQVFESGNVDITVMGDYEDFQIALGLLEERLTPPLKFRWMKDPDQEGEACHESQRLLEQIQLQSAEQIKGKTEQKKIKNRRKRKRK